MRYLWCSLASVGLDWWIQCPSIGSCVLYHSFFFMIILSFLSFSSFRLHCTFQVVRSTGRSECPICLGSPVAGRVGLCGHVYCWPCMLHYSAAHEMQPPPCPVCAMPLLVNDMKPTKMVQWDSPADEVNCISSMINSGR